MSAREIDAIQAEDLDAFEKAYKENFGHIEPISFTRNSTIGQDVYLSYSTMLAYRGWILGKAVRP